MRREECSRQGVKCDATTYIPPFLDQSRNQSVEEVYEVAFLEGDEVGLAEVGCNRFERNNFNVREKRSRCL
jgi:hypothetical protein